jgi:DNA mismatch repair protein MutL
MADIIRLLPESVANQIAAGEVIQRPASIVKELIENSIDAGSTSITVIVKDGGKNLVQVIDNGNGMSETDARMAFERHATSKLATANDLFAIQTMGFRGEALASIASVAEVSLKTRKQGDELGTEIIIAGSQFKSQEPAQCAVGSNFSIKNLFYNVPARRKFLKATSTELKHIITEIQRIAIAFPSVEMALLHNQTEIYNLPKSNLRQRIVNLFGKNFNTHLVDIRSDTSLVRISGFIGKPEAAKKSAAEQFFFVNGRFIRHPYFNKAVTLAYDRLISNDAIPIYFIFFETDPASIDINIHPTKTEVKFEDEAAIWQILHAAVRESLGRFSLTPSLDFETIGVVDIPVLTRNTEIHIPEIIVNRDYNPFEEEDKQKPFPKFQASLNKNKSLDWEKLYDGFQKESPMELETYNQNLPANDEEIQSNSLFFHYKDRYIVMPVKSGLMFIDQKRAHERVLFEFYLKSMQDSKTSSQQNLFPQTIHLGLEEYITLKEISEDLQFLGFDIADLGNNTISINGFPPDIPASESENTIRQIIRDYRSRPLNLKENAREKLAASFSHTMAVPYGKKLGNEEMQVLVDRLFGCDNPGFSPNGHRVLYIYPINEIEKKFT